MGELFGPPDSMSSLVLLPLLICCSRIIDVSLGTLRIIFVSKGFRILAPVMGFFEVLIWIIVISQVMQNLTNVVNYVAYAFGFAVGSFVGMSIERRLSLGMVVVRVITAQNAGELITFMRKEGYGVTVLNAEGSSGHVNVVFTVIKRTDVQDVVGHIKQFNPRAFYTVEDIQSVTEGVFPVSVGPKLPLVSRWIQARQGK
jgi:uncharacterized protein YebE (UPF0316 family)